MRAALRVVVRPHRRDGDHHGVGYALVQLYRAGGGQSHMVFAFDDFAGAIRNFSYINLGRAAAIVPAIEYADAARDGRIIGIRHAPRPVSAHRAGQIHARRTIQHQKILHRRDGGIADAAPRAFQHRGNDIIIPGTHVQRAARERAGFFIAIRPPAQRGIVIVRSGVDHGIFRVLRGQIGVFFIAVEGELKHLHAGIAARLQQTTHLSADHAQILRHDAKLRHRALHALKQLPPRPLFIFPAQRVLRARGHGKIIRKADEMIHAQYIEHARLHAEAIDPPCVAGLFMHIPAVERIAPKLPRGLECIRRHASDANRAQIIVQLKKLRIQPYIAGFIRYVNRHIAHQCDALCLRVGVQPIPLQEKYILAEDVILYRIAQQGGIAFYLVRLAAANALRPAHPGFAVKMILQGAEQRVIAHPCIFFCKAGKIIAYAIVRIRARHAQKRCVLRAHGGEIDAIRIRKRRIRALRQQIIGFHFFKIDQQFIARADRCAFVGRTLRIHAAHRQHLPDVQPRVRREIDKFASRCAHGADAAARGQGSDVQKYAAFSHTINLGCERILSLYAQ